MIANKELMVRLRKAVARAPKDTSDEAHPARSEVAGLLSLLAPRARVEPSPSSKDLSLVGEVINSIVEAAEENVLTEDEADAMARFIIGRFIESKLDLAMRNIFAPSKNQWHFSGSYFRDE